jgi:hypothetical protein
VRPGTLVIEATRLTSVAKPLRPIELMVEELDDAWSTIRDVGLALRRKVGVETMILADCEWTWPDCAVLVTVTL